MFFGRCTFFRILGIHDAPPVPVHVVSKTRTRVSIRLQPPANEILAQFLARRWGAPISITRKIAEGAKGNVRAAMGDLEVWMG
jgi:hypothetical protein